MSAAKKLDPFESQIMAALNELLSGKDHSCDPLNPFYDLDLEVLVRVSSLPNLSKASMEDIFGLREETKSFEISRLSEKQNLLDQVQVEATNFGMNNTLIEDLLTCADELITNSLFNAPFANKVDRSLKELQIPGSEPIRMEISRGQTEVLLSCTDPFGTLDFGAYFRKILSCYENGIADSINYGPGGSGIGSFMVVERVSSLIVGLVPGKRTSFFCRFPTKMSSRKRKLVPKNLLAFHRKEST